LRKLRQLSPQAVVKQIISILQELWMAAHRGRIHAVMIGVGAAFDYHAGTLKRAPEWMQDCGVEWLHRLVSEPRRLWKRYLVTNTLFVLGALRQLIFKR